MKPSGAELNPLVEIERRVQARAKDLVLDLAEPAGEIALRALIEAEIEQWSDDFKHGGRPSSWPVTTSSPSGPSATSPGTARSPHFWTTPTCGRS